ncbi:hypothetical protein O7598_23995 [Micromonospora sp. WMMC241]|uniref:hypothetical protein n=1 Tax=Micromonospora sp. WMMC241 TaxID=3015159 RepID=UPI0022B69D7B|nr:hypothetical protein [Micromonospora sp. WMMC241]MCZ7439487.1 hypothetical protein [Micromonospora sp. WMMC241]
MRPRLAPPALILALLLAGCGGETEQVALPPPASPTPSASAAPLTVKEAKGRYLAVVAAYDIARDELAEAAKAGRPWRSVRERAEAVAAANTACAEELRAVRWPAAAQAPIAALLAEHEVALRHWKLAAGAGSDAVLRREIRAAAAHDGVRQAAKVRAALGLPPRRAA